MQKYFEKIIERLEELGWVFAEYYPDGTEVNKRSRKSVAYGDVIEIVNQVAEEYSEKALSEWCHDCGEYDKEKHYCPRWCKVIRNTVEEIRSGSEIPNKSEKLTGSEGWIPVSSGKLPDTNEAVNITLVNRKPPSYYADIKDKPFTATGHYHNGRWYWYSCVCKDYLDEYGDSIGDRMDGNIEVIAWQPLPAPYQPKGE